VFKRDEGVPSNTSALNFRPIFFQQAKGDIRRRQNFLSKHEKVNEPECDQKKSNHSHPHFSLKTPALYRQFIQHYPGPQCPQHSYLYRITCGQQLIDRSHAL